MVSVRRAVEPLNRALGQSTTIFLKASFVGLPLINQALAAANPLDGGRSFFVTLRTLVQVLETVPIDSVLRAVKAIADANVPVPPKPPSEKPHEAAAPTITASTEGKGAQTVVIVTGRGFLPDRIVTVRVADEQFDPERNFQQTSTPQGELTIRIPLPCNSGLSFHVSATDSRPGPGILGVLFSNNVTLVCS